MDDLSLQHDNHSLMYQMSVVYISCLVEIGGLHKIWHIASIHSPPNAMTDTTSQIPLLTKISFHHEQELLMNSDSWEKSPKSKRIPFHRSKPSHLASP
jgi:hypothetical protein